MDWQTFIETLPNVKMQGLFVLTTALVLIVLLAMLYWITSLVLEKVI